MYILASIDNPEIHSDALFQNVMISVGLFSDEFLIFDKFIGCDIFHAIAQHGSPAGFWTAEHTAHLWLWFMMLYTKTPVVKEISYVQVTGLCTLCPNMQKVANYVQNYALT